MSRVRTSTTRFAVPDEGGKLMAASEFVVNIADANGDGQISMEEAREQVMTAVSHTLPTTTSPPLLSLLAPESLFHIVLASLSQLLIED